MNSVPKAVTRRIHKPRAGTLRLWTFQPPEVWECLQAEGTLFVNPAHRDFEREFQSSYDWLCEQMARRISGYSGHYPWWAYEHFPDLRFYRHHYGTKYPRLLRMELNVDPETVLLSGFDAWHYVLNRWYLSPHGEHDDEDQETEEWHRRVEARGINPYHTDPLPEPFETEMRASWENIFDVEARRPTETVQAVFETLNFADVVKITEFTSVCKSNTNAAE